jgi:hypothetical protein
VRVLRLFEPVAKCGKPIDLGGVALPGQVANLFDGQYSTFGVLGDASLIDDDFEQARFYSPGAPRAGWIGVEVRF